GLINRDLCLEAFRLALLIAEHPVASTPESCALVALMSFHAARFDSRTGSSGEIVLLPDQDRSLWDQDLIRNGFYYFHRSGTEDLSSAYHIEAGIQSVHLAAHSFAETNWAAILGLYKRLYLLRPSPLVKMHMAVSVAKVHGPDSAIKLLREEPLPEYYLYHAILADALEQAGRIEEAAAGFENAAQRTMNTKEKELFLQRRQKLLEMSEN
ncbi:MAG: DUF6596 domain-containing protein, partial [Ignavibacteriota bacterium]